MVKFHVNPESGKPGKCEAVKDSCPFGGAQEHYSSSAEAVQASEALLQDQFSQSALAKPRVFLAKDVTEALVKELYEAAEIYYHKGEESPLTDEEFDAKLDTLQSVADSGRYPELFTPGSVGHNLLESDPAMGTAPEEATVAHKTPMLSLAKAKKEPELESFLAKARRAGAEDFRLQAKLDGLALSVRYEGGKVVKIATRGEGTHGEDATYLLKDPKVTIKGLELTISELGSLEVRGELFFTSEQFEAVDKARSSGGGSGFKNSRNAAAGLMKAAKKGVDYPVEFTFAAYSVLKGDKPANLFEINALGFRTVDQITEDAVGELALTGFKTNAEVLEAVHGFGRVMESFNFPTDGVVIKPTNEAAMLETMGFTTQHPVSQIAWKFPDATAVTEVLAIDVTVGASGKLTPIARVKPVDLDGSEISNASLHNYNLVVTKGIRVGSTILIMKANKIIPQVKAVIANPPESKDLELPTVCPSCASTLAFDKVEGEWPPKTVRCPNVNCESRNFFALKMAVGKSYMDIDGLSEVSLDYLHETGRIKSIADLYSLTLSELADSSFGESQQGNARRLGEKRAQNILNHIEKSKTRSLAKMLPAISIDGMGSGSTRKLEKRFKDIDGILAASEQDIASIPGLGPISAKKIFEGLKLRRATIDQMRSAGVTFGKQESRADASDAVTTNVDLSGKSFTISGAVPPGFSNRGDWVEFVEANGGEFHSSPKATTSFMIGDPTESSSKVKAAVKHGLNFMSPESFSQQFSK